MENRIIALTNELIRFKTIDGNFEEKRNIIDFVKRQFDGHKVYIKEFKSRISPSIVITLKREKTPLVLLNGHLDVVPGDDSQFIPKITGKRIYARGAADMKAGCAVMIEVMKYFSRQKEVPSLALMLTTDEETGGAHGVGVLAKRYKPGIVIIPDGGRNLKTIILKQKGVLHFKIWTHGKSAHGSRPFLGENAIEKLINIYHKIELLIPEAKKEDWNNTVNLGKISGGEVINKVPQYAEAYFDVRFINSYEYEKIFEGISSITKNFKIIASGHACDQEPIEFIERYKRITEKELRTKVEYSRVEGASDARYFAENGSPIIITNIKSGNIHAKNEWVDIRQMNSFYNILVRFITEASKDHE